MTTASNRVFASPLAKRLAAEKGVDLASIKGSGPNGRIVRADVEGAKGGGAVMSFPASGGKPMPGGVDAKMLADKLGMPYTAMPNSGVRKTIARRLLESKQTVPHFYLTVDCVIDDLLEGRKKLNDQGKVKLSVNDFVIKAAALALRRVPAANASWTDEAILMYQNVDISMAVATDGGLITPIIKNADTKSLGVISAEAKDLASRARDGKLKPEEFMGGSFSISNLGMYGIRQFDAIINPPQACILAVGAGEQRPVIRDGALTIATVMTCTLSCDHRVVDGAVGAEYISAFRALIENPLAMLV